MALARRVGTGDDVSVGGWEVKSSGFGISGAVDSERECVCVRKRGKGGGFYLSNQKSVSASQSLAFWPPFLNTSMRKSQFPSLQAFDYFLFLPSLLDWLFIRQV